MASKSKSESSELELTRAEAPRALRPFEELDRMFDYLLPRGWLRPFRWEGSEMAGGLEMRLPKVDVIDQENEIVVRAEMPGVEKRDLDVSLTENTVTIKGQTSHEEKEEKGEYYRCEISRGSFSRTVALPGEIDTEKAKASFKDGVLEMRLPKQARSRRRSVTVE
jgi:HSP20 family protein